jgi:predicted metal-dependent peptidase
MTATEDTISLCILRLRKKAPFFGALALFLRHGLDDHIPTACTDGIEVWFNPDFVDSLTPEELDAVMVHELLHAALLHVPRRGDREPQLWNVAADIVVNGMIRSEKNLSLPLKPCIDATLENLEVEEVYEILRSRPDPPTLSWIGMDLDPEPRPGASAGDGDCGIQAARTHWKQALQQAATVTEALGHGLLPAGMRRHIDRISDPELDWRSLLWRFLVRTPVDYAGFDRRLIGRGLYLETLGGESVMARVAVDTSGSINGEQLEKFLAEVREILRLYPQIDLKLYYADAALHGPFDPQDEGFDQPVGGGGTSFVPFFDRMRDEFDAMSCTVLIYLTDGFGAFPKAVPDSPVLWVVTPGGLASNRFPFGTVSRLL